LPNKIFWVKQKEFFATFGFYELHTSYIQFEGSIVRVYCIFLGWTIIHIDQSTLTACSIYLHIFKIFILLWYTDKIAILTYTYTEPTQTPNSIFDWFYTVENGFFIVYIISNFMKIKNLYKYKFLQLSKFWILWA
jgi:hypothetical protein